MNEARCLRSEIEMTPQTLEKANLLNGKIRSIKSEIEQLAQIRKGTYGMSLGVVSSDSGFGGSHFTKNSLSHVSKQALDAALCAMLNDLEGQLSTLKEELEAL